MDKHRLIHASFATTADEPPDVDVVFADGPDDAVAEVIYLPKVLLADGAEVLRVRLRPSGSNEPNIVVKGGLPVDVAFGDARLRLKDLYELLRVVAEIVERQVGEHVARMPREPRESR